MDKKEIEKKADLILFENGLSEKAEINQPLRNDIIKALQSAQSDAVDKKEIIKILKENFVINRKGDSLRYAPEHAANKILEQLQSTQSDAVKRNAKIEFLDSYSKYLEKNGFMDTDWRTEEPYAIDDFLTNN